MKLIADENIDRLIVRTLRDEGFEVIAIGEIARGETDDEVLARSVAGAGILLTEDKDFGEMVFRRGMDQAGIVLIRLGTLSRVEKCSVVVQAFQEYASRFRGSFAVIDRGGIRLREAIRVV